MTLKIGIATGTI